METLSKVGDKQFKWGKKRVTGAEKTDVQFYESFTYGGSEYSLYDCVFTTDSFVGKIIKMWEHIDQRQNSRKVELLWFFRSSEIPAHFEKVQDELPNELFLASGTGVGLTNENQLGTICGKCNVLCISKDIRNPQPSDEEIKLADFLFYRTVDVGSGKISEKIDDKIAGVDVKFIFNRTSVEKNASAVQKVAFPEERFNKDPGRRDGGLDCCIGPGYTRNDWHRKDQDNEVEKQLTRQKSRLAEERLSTDSCSLDDSPQKKRKLDGPIAVSDVREKSRLGEERRSRYLYCSDDMLQKKRGLDGSDRRIKKSEKIRHDGRKDIEPTRGHRDNVNAGEVYSQKLSHTDKKQDLRIPKFSEGKETRHATEKDSFKKTNSDCQSKLTERKILTDADYRRNYRIFEVTQNPVENKWYRDLPLEETLRGAVEQENLVLLRNLDPSYTSKEVENIVYSALNEYCTARMIERTSATIPHIGEALVLFKTSDAAERAIRRLNEGCLLLSNGRILVATNAKVNSQAPPLQFTGHIQPRALMRQKKNAVATSHSSQANTIEYEMGMEWCLYRDRYELSWKRVYEQQMEEMKKLHIKFSRKLA